MVRGFNDKSRAALAIIDANAPTCLHTPVFENCCEDACAGDVAFPKLINTDMQGLPRCFTYKTTIKITCKTVMSKTHTCLA